MATHPWIKDEHAISAVDFHRLYLRVRYHGSKEIFRLAGRMVEQALGGGQ